MSVYNHILMRRARNDCAAHYAQAAVFQQQLDEELLERLLIVKVPIRRIAVLGAGNPTVVLRLLTLFPGASITLLDISQVLLRRDQQSLAGTPGADVQVRVCELKALPDDDHSFDLVYSNLFLAMSDDMSHLLKEVQRVLRPGGCFHFSCLGADTFCELHAAWRTAEGSSASHVGTMPDMHDTGDALVHANFCEPVMDCENFTLTYSTPAALFADLRANGVRNCLGDRQRSLTGKQRWRRFVSALEAARLSDRYALTLEAVLGQAWKPEKAGQSRLEDGSVAIPVERLRAPRV
ncbi:MAG: methyltransferase domain-containing protein [Gammaproteobacteria bacterium]|nr:methyltransferase domain-containing protein [Gammaproteobacteria bacterium]